MYVIYVEMSAFSSTSSGTGVVEEDLLGAGWGGCSLGGRSSDLAAELDEEEEGAEEGGGGRGGGRCEAALSELAVGWGGRDGIRGCVTGEGLSDLELGPSADLQCMR